MRKLTVYLAAFVLAFLATGCDSNDSDDQSDAELFVGTWTLTSISDDTGDQTAGFAGLANSLTVDFDNQSDFALLVDYKDDSGRQDLELVGDYEVREDSEDLILMLGGAGGPSLTFAYEFENDDEVTLSVPAGQVNPLFQPTTDYEGDVDVVIRRQ